jgi:FKBP-type peptidyl-prolyl cis-trans isomerase
MRIAGKVTMVTVALAAAAALSACANSEQDSTRSNATSTPPPLPTSTSRSTTTATATTTTSSGGVAQTAGECKADDVKVEGAVGAKPTITIPATCKPPTTLLTKDLTPGTGAAVTANSGIQAHYLLETWSDKNIVDNSYDRGQPYPIENVGQAQVIPGWKQGLIGVKQGGRRLMIIPPNLGYGPQGQNPVKPNETLVFVIDAVQVS